MIFEILLLIIGYVSNLYLLAFTVYRYFALGDTKEFMDHVMLIGLMLLGAFFAIVPFYNLYTRGMFL